MMLSCACGDEVIGKYGYEFLPNSITMICKSCGNEIIDDESPEMINESKFREGRFGQLRYLAIPLFAISLLAAILGSSSASLNSSTHDYQIELAISNYQVNDADSTTVYQQMVTNGWVTKDLLEIVAKQNSSIITNQVETARLSQNTNILLAFCIIAISLLGLSLVGTIKSIAKSLAE